MNLRDQLNAITPRLRRYARALAMGSPAPCEFADDLVHATLMRAIGGRSFGEAGELAIRLYTTITHLHREVAASGRSAMVAGGERPTLVTSAPGMPTTPRHTNLSAGLLSLSLENREALLLVALEGFEHGEAARILRISRSALVGRLTNARTTLDAFLHARPSVRAPTRHVPHLRVVS